MKKSFVSGTVKDLSDNSGKGKVASISVEIVGVTGNENISLNKDGSFFMTLKTNGAGYNSDIVIKLTATDTMPALPIKPAGWRLSIWGIKGLLPVCDAAEEGVP